MKSTRPTIDFVRTGIRAALSKKGLALLLFLVNAILALAVALPLFYTLGAVFGDSGFGPDLAKKFNLPVWSDIWNELTAAQTEGGGSSEIKMFRFLLLISLPFLLLWKTASSVGIINAVRDRGLRGFWEGVGRYSGRAILLAIPYLLISVVSIVGVVILMSTVGTAIGSEQAIFWCVVIGMPVFSILVLAILDLMHDNSRIALVAREEPVMTALGSGFAWPFKNRRSILIYGCWMLIGGLLVVVPILLDSMLTAGTWLGLGVLFLLQQIAMFFRASTTIGWFASEVEYFESVRFYEEPLIADASDNLRDESDNASMNAPAPADTNDVSGSDTSPNEGSIT